MNLKHYFVDLCHVFVTDFQTIHSMILKNLILEKRIRYTSLMVCGLWVDTHNILLPMHNNSYMLLCPK